MRTLSLFFICLATLYVQAQDFVIGGKVNESANNEKYDSLRNFYNYSPKERMMIGQEFTYYNTVDYLSKDYYNVPYPWKDGRSRAGRYTSSQTAKDAYLAELKQKSGTKYRLTDIVPYESYHGYVFTDDNGESILYTNPSLVNWEFVCDGYKEKFRKMYVGKEVYCLSENLNMNSIDLIGIGSSIIGLQSREIRHSLPNMSKWLVKGLGVDTTYYGNRPDNDGNNNICRLVFVIHNDELGDYEVFVDNSGMMFNGPVQNTTPKFLLTTLLSQKTFSWGENISTSNWNGSIPSEILSSARNGDPDAIYAIINYSNFAVFHEKNTINISFDEYLGLLDKAVELGYIHKRTSKWLFEIARHYIHYSIEDQNDGKNDYEKGAPYLIKAANLGEKKAREMLMKCVEKGKIKQ